MKKWRAGNDDADCPKDHPHYEPPDIGPLPVFLFDLDGALARAPVGAEENQRNVDQRRAHDHAERDQERDLAKRLPGLEPADRYEIGDQRPTDQASDERGDTDARAD